MTGEANLFLADLQQPAPDPSSQKGRMDPEIGDFLAFRARQTEDSRTMRRNRDVRPDLWISSALEIRFRPIPYSLNRGEFAVSGEPGPLRQVNKRRDVCLNRTPGCDCRSNRVFARGMENGKLPRRCYS